MVKEESDYSDNSSTEEKMTTQPVYSAIQQPAAMEQHGNMAFNWREWKRSLDYFMIASGRDKASSDEKCAVFLHVIGKYGREVYEEFDFGSKHPTYDQLVQKFTERFDPEKNVNFERHVLFECYQKETNIDDYLSDLKIKSKSCEFGTLRNSLILTQLIRGVKDTHMRERLLAKSKLDLEEAAALCRAAERASSQAAVCGSGVPAAEAPAIAVEEMARSAGSRGRGRRPRGWRAGGSGHPGVAGAAPSGSSANIH